MHGQTDGQTDGRTDRAWMEGEEEQELDREIDENVKTLFDFVRKQVASFVCAPRSVVNVELNKRAREIGRKIHT